LVALGRRLRVAEKDPGRAQAAALQGDQPPPAYRQIKKYKQWKIMKKITLLTFMALSLCACDKVYDSSYYQANCKQAVKVLESCKSGEVSGDNCKNAAKG
jgi:hypothetical protein